MSFNAQEEVIGRHPMSIVHHFDEAFAAVF
jgi:hypothetical protein